MKRRREMRGINGFVIALVLLRFVFGVLTGMAFINQDFTYGAIFFAIGLFTKMVDIPMSVWSGRPIPADDEVYRIVAVAFNGSAFFGLMYGLCEMASTSELSWLYPVLLLAINGALMSVSLLGRWVPWVRPHSYFAKWRSGVISFAMMCLVLSVAYSPLVGVITLLSAVFFAGDVAYKAHYYSKLPQ